MPAQSLETFQLGCLPKCRAKSFQTLTTTGTDRATGQCNTCQRSVWCWSAQTEASFGRLHGRCLFLVSSKFLELFPKNSKMNSGLGNKKLFEFWVNWGIWIIGAFVGKRPAHVADLETKCQLFLVSKIEHLRTRNGWNRGEKQGQTSQRYWKIW